MRRFALCWSLWLQISTDIKVSMPLCISAFFHVLEMVRAASSIFVERCKCISYQVLSWIRFVTFHLLVAGLHQQYCIKNREPLSLLSSSSQHPDGSCNTMLTFHVEGSLFPHVQVTSWCQRQWHVLHMFTVRIQIGTTVVQKEIALHGKQRRKPLSL